MYRILSVIRSALIYLWSNKNRGMRYKPDVNSHRVTLDCIMRDSLKRGMRYKQDVRVSLREYGISIPLYIRSRYTEIWHPKASSLDLRDRISAGNYETSQYAGRFSTLANCFNMNTSQRYNIQKATMRCNVRSNCPPYTKIWCKLYLKNWAWRGMLRAWIKPWWWGMAEGRRPEALPHHQGFIHTRSMPRQAQFWFDNASKRYEI